MHHHTLHPAIINLFFIIGLISATLFRSLTIVDRFSPGLVRPLWYLGVGGYLLFFGYRYRIARKRRAAISENNLIEKLQSGELSNDERDEIAYLLHSLQRSKEIYNYLYIFFTSIVAITADIFLSQTGH
jgi:hypothetical protein